MDFRVLDFTCGLQRLEEAPPPPTKSQIGAINVIDALTTT